MAKAVLKFQPNEPVELALAFPQGKIQPSAFGGDQMMYTLEYPPEHITFLDLAAAQKLNVLAPAKGERLMICKRKGADRNSAVKWDVWLSPDAEAARAAQESGVPLKSNGRPAWGGNPPPPTWEEAKAAKPAATDDDLLERQLRASLAEVERKKAAAAVSAAAADHTHQSTNRVSSNGSAPAAREAWTEMLLAQTNALTEVFRSACEHAAGVDPEDVRTLMVTAYINLVGKR